MQLKHSKALLLFVRDLEMSSQDKCWKDATKKFAYASINRLAKMKNHTQLKHTLHLFKATDLRHGEILLPHVN